MDGFDLGVCIRDEAVRILKECPTLAGHAVEAERVDPVETGDMPRIVVMADETAETNGSAGSLAAFRVTLNLAIHCYVERPRKQDAVADLDRLLTETKHALFRSPDWLKLSENIASYRTARKFEGRDRQIVGEAQLLITCTWRITYNPRVDTPLTTVTMAPLAQTPDGATPIAPIRSDGSPTVTITLPGGQPCEDEEP